VRDSSANFFTVDSEISIKWNRLFRGSEHDFCSAAFHRLCDNQGPTSVLVRAENGRMEAGYSCVSWKSVNRGGSEPNPRGFLCDIDSNELSSRLFKGVSGKCNIFQYSPHGPYFYDLFVITDKCDKNPTSQSNLGQGFENHGDYFALFGSQTFTVDEYEVFVIEFV
jgi:hypothetical protein